MASADVRGRFFSLVLLQVYFWEFQRKNQTERLRTLFMPEGGVKLKNLTGYTTYMISVAPFNAAGDGPRSPPTRGRTQQAGAWVPTRIANHRPEKFVWRKYQRQRSYMFAGGGVGADGGWKEPKSSSQCG